MVTVFIRALEFYGFHGVSSEERSVGHRYTADIELKVDTSACFTDNVEDTVDYARAAACVLEVSEKNSCKTLERLVQITAQVLLDEFPAITEVKLGIAKRLPPAPVIAEAMGVTIILTRSFAL